MTVCKGFVLTLCTLNPGTGEANANAIEEGAAASAPEGQHRASDAIECNEFDPLHIL